MISLAEKFSLEEKILFDSSWTKILKLDLLYFWTAFPFLDTIELQVTVDLFYGRGN